jgi:hypothetical protein
MEFIIPKFIEDPTRFERHTAHHQELQTVFGASGLYIHLVTGRFPDNYITFERGGRKFSNTTARALNYCTAMQQRQLRAKWLLYSTRFFSFMSSLKLSLNCHCCTAVR